LRWEREREEEKISGLERKKELEKERGGGEERTREVRERREKERGSRNRESERERSGRKRREGERVVKLTTGLSHIRQNNMSIKIPWHLILCQGSLLKGRAAY
jgi:hypothetical protein